MHSLFATKRPFANPSINIFHRAYIPSFSRHRFTRTPSLSITTNMSLRASFTAHGVTWLSSEIDSSRRRDRTLVQSGGGTRASRMRPRLSGTGSATSRKEFAGPCIPGVVQPVHQDESPGRRLFYYANTRSSFARATLNTADRLPSTCLGSRYHGSGRRLVCSNMQRRSKPDRNGFYSLGPW